MQHNMQHEPVLGEHLAAKLGLANAEGARVGQPAHRADKVLGLEAPRVSRVHVLEALGQVLAHVVLGDHVVLGAVPRNVVLL